MTFLNDISLMINAQCVQSYADNKEKGFHEDEKHKEKDVIIAFKLTRLALITSEVSETIEGIRKEVVDDHLPQYPQEWVEMADTLERVFDYCGRYDIPLGEVWAAKKEYNKTRPYKHGKKV